MSAQLTPSEIGGHIRDLQAIIDAADAEAAKAAKKAKDVRAAYGDMVDELKAELQQILIDQQARERAAGAEVTKTLRIDSLTQVSSKRGQPKWNYGDEPGLVTWLQDNEPELVRTVTKHEVAKDQMKKTFEVTDDGFVVNPETGAVIPGVVVTPAEVTYTVTVGGKS